MLNFIISVIDLLCLPISRLQLHLQGQSAN